MALIDSIILPKPCVLIIAGGSSLDGVPDSSVNFGRIVKIYETSDLYTVGENVAYNPQFQQKIGYSNYVYIKIDEQHIFYSEEIA